MRLVPQWRHVRCIPMGVYFAEHLRQSGVTRSGETLETIGALGPRKRNLYGQKRENTFPQLQLRNAV